MKKYSVLIINVFLSITTLFFYLNVSNKVTLGASECLSMSDSLLSDIESGKTKVTYECFGAVGDGKTNDYAAIKKAHDFANNEYAKKGIFLTVYASSNKTYYLGSNDIDGKILAIQVATDTDWQNAKFIVDDNNNIDSSKALFSITSPMQIATGKSVLEYKSDNSTATSSEVWKNRNFTKNVGNLKSLVDAIVNDNKIMTSEQKKYFNSSNVIAIVPTDNTQVFFRSGNQNSGSNQTEMILVDKNSGKVLNDILFDYKNVTRLRVFPIPNRKITIKNATFTTRTLNQAVTNDKQNSYVQRNIYVNFTGNVNISNVKHFLDESYKTNNSQTNPNGNAYYGFIRLYNAAYINMDSISLTPHSFAKYNGGSTSYGTYDLTFDVVSHLKINNLVYACNASGSECYANTMINSKVWGLIGSNESKNVYITNSKFNRMDAHRGIRNLYIADTTIGDKGLTLTGTGNFYGKNLRMDRSDQIVRLRPDYGSSWDGVMVLNNITYIVNDNISTPAIITSKNDGKNYGYSTYFPALYVKNVTIDTKTYNSSKDVYAVILNEDVSPNALYKYAFKGNIRLLNVSLDKKSGSSNTLYLFKDSFVKDNNISIHSYNNSSKVNIGYYNLDSSFKYASTQSNIDKLKNSSLFSYTYSDSTNTTVDNKISDMESFFNTMSSSLGYSAYGGNLAYISSIKVNNGNVKLNEQMSNSRDNYSVNVGENTKSVTLSITGNSDTSYVDYPQTVNLTSNKTVVSFVARSAYGEGRTYTLTINRATSSGGGSGSTTPPSDSGSNPSTQPSDSGSGSTNPSSGSSTTPSNNSGSSNSGSTVTPSNNNKSGDNKGSTTNNSGNSSNTTTPSNNSNNKSNSSSGKSNNNNGSSSDSSWTQEYDTETPDSDAIVVDEESEEKGISKFDIILFGILGFVIVLIIITSKKKV